MFVLGIARRIYTSLACTHHTVAQLVYQTIDWSKQPRALPHFTNGHLFCLLFFSLHLFIRNIHHSFSFHSSTMFVTISATPQVKLEKGDVQVENIEALVPPCAC